MAKHFQAMSILIAVVAGAFGLAAIAGPTEKPGTTPQAFIRGASEFHDDLDPLDPKLWSVSDGWYNGSYMVNDWQKSQVHHEDGSVSLILSPNSASETGYSGGEIQSIARYGHGYYEARFRAAPGSGIVTGFFTYIGPFWDKPWNEIDVEIVGRKPREALLTYHIEGEKVSQIVPLDFDATQSYHVYGFDWQPDGIRWYIDGELVHEVRGEKLPLPQERQKIMLSVWGTETLTDWLGPLDESALPSTATFTCIAYSPTRESGERCR